MHLVTSSLLEWQNKPTDKSENSTTKPRAIFLTDTTFLQKPRGSLDWTLPSGKWINMWSIAIECFHSRGQHLCKFIGTKESF